MKHKLFRLAPLLIVALGFCVSARAQAVTGRADLSWTNPTTSVDSVPLTGTAALTEIRLYVATAPITTLPATPTQTLVGTPTTVAYTTTVTNGQTLYFRLTACNKPVATSPATCSAMSAEASKVILLNTTPNAPTSVTVTLTITP